MKQPPLKKNLYLSEITMNKIAIILSLLLLSACASKPTQLAVPDQIEYQNKAYQLAKWQDLDTVARYVYLSAPDTPEKWQSQIEVLLDRNMLNRSIEDRIELRERVYRSTDVVSFKLAPVQHEKTKKAQGLSGYVVYAPSATNPSWQVDVMRGQNIPQCGFVQFQYSQKVKNSRHLSREKVLRHLQKYLIANEVKTLDKMDWRWHCRHLT